MIDPVRENIDGEMIETHSFEHRIDWGYVALGLAAIFVVWKVSVALDGGKDDEGGLTTQG